MEVVHVALLKEDVGLVQQEDGAPRMADVEDLLQLRFQETGVGAELAGRGHIQRTLEQLADPLCSERLAGAGRSMENRCVVLLACDCELSTEMCRKPTNEPLALALNDVVDAFGGMVLVRFYKSLSGTLASPCKTRRVGCQSGCS